MCKDSLLKAELAEQMYVFSIHNFVSLKFYSEIKHYNKAPFMKHTPRFENWKTFVSL